MLGWVVFIKFSSCVGVFGVWLCRYSRKGLEILWMSFRHWQTLSISNVNEMEIEKVVGWWTIKVCGFSVLVGIDSMFVRMMVHNLWSTSSLCLCTCTFSRTFTLKFSCLFFDEIVLMVLIYQGSTGVWRVDMGVIRCILSHRDTHLIFSLLLYEIFF